jgi:hypothetical protein
MSDKRPWPLTLKGLLAGAVIGGAVAGFHAVLFGETLGTVEVHDMGSIALWAGIGVVVGAALGAWIGSRSGVKGHARHHGEPKRIEPR